MPFILLGNIASSLKFELISPNIKLVFFYAMELDTRELFRCLARDCNYRDENYAMFQKRIALRETIYLLSKLRSSWRFLKFCDNADGHSQTGNRKKISGSWIRKTSRENKGYDKRLETLFTHCRSNIYLHKLPFTVDLTDIKSWIVFKFR